MRCINFKSARLLLQIIINIETMEMNIPVIQKTTVSAVKKDAQASSCCTPNDNASVCCTPSETKEDNNGACCDQPEDGSACCNK